MTLRGQRDFRRRSNVQSTLNEKDLIAVPRKFVKRQEQFTQAGDILVSTANSWELVGKCSWVPDLNYSATIGGFISSLRADPKVAFPRYLYHWFNSPETQLKARNCGRQTTNISNMDMKRCLQIEIPLPPLEQQKRIAAILDKADELRAKRRYAIAKLDELLKSVFLELFGDPVTNPKGWTKRPLAELVSIDAPMVDPRKKRYQNHLHIGADRIERDTGQLLEARTAHEDRLISGKFLFDDRYILYSKIRPYLRKVAAPSFEGLCSADVYPVRPSDNRLSKTTLYYVLLSDSFTNFTEKHSGRANIPKINSEQFLSFECYLPPPDVQDLFENVYEQTRQQKALLEMSHTNFDNLFASLQARAFSGDLTPEALDGVEAVAAGS